MPRLKPTLEEIEKYLHLLDETPRRINACTAGLNEARLQQPPGERAWSAVEVLAHLRACDDLWSHSVFAMLVNDHPELPLLDERRWVKVRGYADLGFRLSIQAFALGRAELLGVLCRLPEPAWERTAVIGGRVHSVFSQVRRLALHEVEHREQLETLLSCQKKSATSS